MRILVVNDDGINSPYLEILVKVASKYGFVYVSAPLHHQSAKSHAISIHPKILVNQSKHIVNSEKTIAIDGYPADTVRLGLKIFDTKFDLVLSGVNEGFNLSTDTLYSGTVGAAREAAILGIPGVAVSTGRVYDEHLETKIGIALDDIINKKLYEKYPLLNVNIPNDEKVRGIKYTSVGKRLFHAEFNQLPDSNEYSINYSLMIYEEASDADSYAIDDGYISISPILVDQTNYDELRELQNKK